MQQLDTFVNMVVAQVRQGSITVGMLTAQLIRHGMEEEEITLLLEIVALEVKLTKPPTFAMVRAAKAYKTTTSTRRQQLLDVVG